MAAKNRVVRFVKQTVLCFLFQRFCRNAKLVFSADLAEKTEQLLWTMTASHDKGAEKQRGLFHFPDCLDDRIRPVNMTE